MRSGVYLSPSGDEIIEFQTNQCTIEFNYEDTTYRYFSNHIVLYFLLKDWHFLGEL